MESAGFLNVPRDPTPTPPEKATKAAAVKAAPGKTGSHKVVPVRDNQSKD